MGSAGRELEPGTALLWAGRHLLGGGRVVQADVGQHLALQDLARVLHALLAHHAHRAAALADEVQGHLLQGRGAFVGQALQKSGTGARSAAARLIKAVQPKCCAALAAQAHAVGW